MPRNCPKCGQTLAKAGSFIEGFCPVCYFQQNPIITLHHKPQVKICPRCEAYWSMGQWVPKGETPIDEHCYNLVCDLLDPLFTPSQPATFEVHIVDRIAKPISKIKRLRVAVDAQAEQLPYQESKTLTIPIDLELCDRCKRSAGGYFEAVLQIRTSTGKLSPQQEDQIIAYIKTQLAALPPPVDPPKLTDTRGGIDMKFISGRAARKLANQVAKQFGLILGVSSKVAGRTRNGKTQTRETYVVRFPPYQIGDVLAVEDRAYVVLNISKGRYVLVDLETSQRRPYSPKELAALQGQNLKDQVQDYLVISQSPDFYQLMSQSDYSIYDVPTPPFPLAVGETVQAMFWKDHLKLLPKEES